MCCVRSAWLGLAWLGLAGLGLAWLGFGGNVRHPGGRSAVGDVVIVSSLGGHATSRRVTCGSHLADLAASPVIRGQSSIASVAREPFPSISNAVLCRGASERASERVSE